MLSSRPIPTRSKSPPTLETEFVFFIDMFFRCCTLLATLSVTFRQETDYAFNEFVF